MSECEPTDEQLKLSKSLIDMMQMFNIEKGLCLNHQWQIILHIIFKQIYDIMPTKESANNFISHAKKGAYDCSKDNPTNFTKTE